LRSGSTARNDEQEDSMAKRFLVPLDHRSLAEPSMAIVADAARAAGGTVRLLHVAPVPGIVVTPDGRTVAYADQETSRIEAQHLDELRRFEPTFAGMAVEAVVRFGEPVEEILAESDSYGADVIVVMTTCRNGLTRTLLGSVAEQLVRKAGPVVMLLRPAADALGT
jgi:nucleotide-binding universal stress UspA family protein